MNRATCSYLLVVLALFVCASSAAPSPPSWPSKYFLTGTFSIPYFNISQPVVANYDAVTNRQRFDYYGSLTSYLSLNNQNKQYEVVPRLDRKTCFVSNSSGPLTQVLPDMSVFNYRGVARINGWIVENWEQRTLNYSRVGVYNFYVNRQPDGTVRPIRFAMNGHDNVFGSHPDVYIFDYNAYIPNYNTPDAWTVSSVCQRAEPATPSAAARARMHYGGIALLFGSVPQPEQVEEQTEETEDTFGSKLSERVVKMFAEHCKQYGKQYAHGAEYNRRLRIFNENLDFIESWNKKQTGSVLAMNHFSDWSREEFLNVMLPKSRNKRAQSVNRVAPETEEEKARLTAGLPANVDWASAGAVTPVKDQGICGSCWTFGTTGTIEGAHFIKHRQLVSLSEQQIVDCAWGYQWSGPGGNLGCDGGYAAGALQWVMDNNGIATEQSYKYLMQDAFCLKQDTSSGVRLKGYVNVTAFSEAALQQAVAIGPVAVAIDASHPAFTYYSSGVIYQPDCKNDIPDLDHEVLAVGYGTYQGQDYWLVKNSWSTHWGINGYVMMARNRGNNCGIASQANYALAA